MPTNKDPHKDLDKRVQALSRKITRGNFQHIWTVDVMPIHHLLLQDRNAFLILWHIDRISKQAAKLVNPHWGKEIAKISKKFSKIANSYVLPYRQALRRVEISKNTTTREITVRHMGIHQKIGDIEIGSLQEIEQEFAQAPYPKPRDPKSQGDPKGKRYAERRKLNLMDYHANQIIEALESMRRSIRYMGSTLETQFIVIRRDKLETLLTNLVQQIHEETDIYDACGTMAGRLGKDPFQDLPSKK